MLVLIVGATGVLGQETVRCLCAAGHQVRGMTRHAQRARDLEALGAVPVIGDLTDACVARARLRRRRACVRGVPMVC